MKTVEYKKEYQFAYVGICDSVKSQKQLKGLNYNTYLFDCDKNRDMQEQVMHAVVLFELFFSAPHESVWYFDQEGPVFEPNGDYNHENQELTAGIKDFVIKSKPFAEKYGIRIGKKEAVAGIARLVRGGYHWKPPECGWICKGETRRQIYCKNSFKSIFEKPTDRGLLAGRAFKAPGCL